MHDTNDIRKSKELHDKEIEWIKLHPYRQQLLGSFGYANPDEVCIDWDCDSIAGKLLCYEELGCMCCDNLQTEKNPPLRNKKIVLSCEKEHTLVVGVLKED